MCLGEKLVGIANQLFGYCLRKKTLMGEGQLLAYDVFERKAGASMSFTYSGVSLVTFRPHDCCSKYAMADVWLFAMTVDAGGVGHEYADVVKHGGFFHKSQVEI
jgi:hypothetical protein